jgi:mevalonate kinase
LVDLGHSLPTRDAVALAWAARERLPEAERTALRDRISQATESAAAALASGNLQQLATALAAAGETMPALGVVDIEMTALLTRMRNAGALAAKQTGAGLGGMLLGLAADPASAAAIATACGDLAAAVWTMPVAPPD